MARSGEAVHFLSDLNREIVRSMSSCSCTGSSRHYKVADFAVGGPVVYRSPLALLCLMVPDIVAEAIGVD